MNRQGTREDFRATYERVLSDLGRLASYVDYPKEALQQMETCDDLANMAWDVVFLALHEYEPHLEKEQDV